MLRPTSSRGFTLIEIAVVLVCLGLLAAIAVPTYNYFMDRTDVSVARAEAEALVRNAVGVSSLDGYDYYCPPTPEGDTTPFWMALEDVDREQGTTVWAEPYDQWVDYLGVTQEGWGVVQVIGVRWTHYFLLDMCTGDLYDAYLDPGDSGGNGNDPGNGDPGGGNQTLALSYTNTNFNPDQLDSSIQPTVTGDLGPDAFSLTGTLPPDVTFDPDTGVFTNDNEYTGWNFKATQVAGSGAQGCALTVYGTVKCWGSNQNGELGRGTLGFFDPDNPWERQWTYDKYEVMAWQPNYVHNGETLRWSPLVGVTKLVSNVSHSYYCALTSAGKVVCWGGGSGRTQILKDPATGTALTGIIDYDMGCAVRSNGTVMCWGFGEPGETVVGPDGSPLTGVTQIETGVEFACALLASGKVVCWGSNANGRTGRGSVSESTQPYLDPAFVVGVGEAAGGSPLTGVVEISSGPYSTCAVLTSGRVVCWGAWSRWMATTTPQDPSEDMPSPRYVLNDGGYLEGVASIEVSGSYSFGNYWGGYDASTCALMRDSTVQCWGAQTHQESLGRGLLPTDDSRFDPEPVAQATEGITAPGAPSGQLSGVTHLSSGNCAVTQDHSIYCWGPMRSMANGSGTTEGYPPRLYCFYFYCASHSGYGVYKTSFPLRITTSGPAEGYPASVTVTVTDVYGQTTSTQVTLGVQPYLWPENPTPQGEEVDCHVNSWFLCRGSRLY